MQTRIQALAGAVEAFTRGVLVAVGLVLVVCLVLLSVVWECLHDYWRGSLVLVLLLLLAVYVGGRCG